MTRVHRIAHCLAVDGDLDGLASTGTALFVVAGSAYYLDALGTVPAATLWCNVSGGETGRHAGERDINGALTQNHMQSS